jgi:hypothetical protein
MVAGETAAFRSLDNATKIARNIKTLFPRSVSLTHQRLNIWWRHCPEMERERGCRTVTRSVLAVIAGIAALTVTSFAIEWLTEPVLTSVFPDVQSEGATSQNVIRKLIMFVYTTFCVACGGYVTAWVARGSEVRHAVIMGVIQMAMTSLAMIKFHDKAPLWFWIAGIVFTVPAAWCGGIFRVKVIARTANRRKSVEQLL